MFNASFIIFGYQIDLLFFSNVSNCSYFICLFFMLAIQFKKVDYTSMYNLVLLIDFLIKYHPEIKSFNQITEAKKEVSDKLFQKYWVLKHYDEFITSGKFITYPNENKNDKYNNILYVLLAPYASLDALFSVFIDEREYKFHR